MPIFLLAALGVPALYVGLIRGLALACAPTRETDSQAATWLRWLHWLVTGSALLCLVLVTGELELHYPLFVLAWLLGSGVLAGGRLRLRQLLPEESSWGKFQAWGLGLLSPLLLGAALASRADVAFEDANARVEVDRSFAWEANEGFGRLRFYQTRCFLFHEQVGRRHQRQIEKPSAGTMYSRDWWAVALAVVFDPAAHEAQVFFAGTPERAVTIRLA